MNTMGFIANDTNNKYSKTKTPSPTGHSLTIGETGSGKTTAVIRPLIKQAVEQGSSILLVDEKNLLHLDLKFIEPDSVKKVFQLGGIGGGSNDISINLLEIIKTKKQFKKFADTLMGVTNSDNSHNFWARSASNMLVDVYMVLDAVKKVIQYAQSNVIGKDILFEKEAIVTGKKKELGSLFGKEEESTPDKTSTFKITAEPLTFKELFYYFNDRVVFKLLSEQMEFIGDELKHQIAKEIQSDVDQEHVIELDRLMDRVYEYGSSLKKWKINYETTGSSGNNGVYFTVSASLGELAEIDHINDPEGVDIVSLLEEGRHVVINGESLSTQVVSIILSRVLDILSLRAKRENVQPVSVIIDEASRVMDSDFELHTDFLRQAKVSVHLATQHETQIIEIFGENRWKTYQTNFQDIFTLSTHSYILKPFYYHDKRTDQTCKSQPLFFDRTSILKSENMFQRVTGQYEHIRRSEDEIVMYDARLYELKEQIIVINAMTLDEIEMKYKHSYHNRNGFFQKHLEIKKKYIEDCEVINCF